MTHVELNIINWCIVPLSRWAAFPGNARLERAFSWRIQLLPGLLNWFDIKEQASNCRHQISSSQRPHRHNQLFGFNHNAPDRSLLLLSLVMRVYVISSQQQYLATVNVSGNKIPE